MKKKTILLLSLLTILFSGCGKNVDSIYNEYKLSSNVNVDKKNTSLEEIDYDTYSKKIANKETFILLIFQTGCQHCESFEPKLNEVIKYYNIKVYSLNRANLSEKESAILENKTYVTGTPTLVHFIDGKFDPKNKIVGNKEIKDILKFLVGIEYLEEK